jgi:hypothetical protein
LFVDEIWQQIDGENDLAEVLEIPNYARDQEDADEEDIIELDEEGEDVVTMKQDLDQDENVAKDHDEDDAQNDTQDDEEEHCGTCKEEIRGDVSQQCERCHKTCHPHAPCSYVEPLLSVDDGSTTSTCVVLCYMCHSDVSINTERTGAKRVLEKQAKRMLEASKKKFCELSVGDAVVVPVPDVDRGRSDFRNIPAVVTEKQNGMYTLGTKHGCLKQMYSRNQVIPTKCVLVSPDEVTAQQVSLREVARSESLGSGQGYGERCNCKAGCKGKMCKCRRLGRLCGSKCHHSLSCSNKADVEDVENVEK